MTPAERLGLFKTNTIEEKHGVNCEAAVKKKN
jgi:hypothetical protein